MNVILVGLQWGDEGKGKIVDWLCSNKEYNFKHVVKFNGGPNAGANIKIKDKQYKLHHIPAGILSDKKCYISSGCLINPEKLLQEIEQLEQNNIQVKNNLFIDYRCHIIKQSHISKDQIKKDSGIMTTGQGMGPCFSDKVKRENKRIKDSLEEFPFLRDYVCDVSELLRNADKKKESILFQGSQGVMLDVDYGTYPYVTSSNCLPQYACVSCGFPMQKIDKIIGVAKCYTTRSGSGPMTSEITNERLQEIGKEYGTTTGRKRRVGWLDIYTLNKAIEISGVDEVILTKVDVLEKLGEMRIFGFGSYNKTIDFVMKVKSLLRTDMTHYSDGEERNEIKSV